MDASSSFGKRSRDDSAAGATQAASAQFDRRGRRQFDPSFYADVGEGDHAARDGDAGVFGAVGHINFEERRPRGKGAAKGDAPGKAAAHTLQNQQRVRRRDNEWQRQMMERGGVHTGFGDGDEAGDDDDKRDDAPPEVRLVVDKKPPPFLSNAADGDFSRQYEIVLPVKDKQSALALAAKKGSESLGKHSADKRARQATKDNMATDGADIAAIGMGGEGEMTEEELERLRRKERLNRWKNAGEEERKALQKDDQDTAMANLKAQSSMKGVGQASSDRQVIAETRQRLPIFSCRKELMQWIDEHSVTIVMGETGSGKTTQMVQYLYERGYAAKAGPTGPGGSIEGIIGCTQPRRMAAVGVASRVADEMGVELGSTVGYAIRLEDETSDATRLKFMTDGVLLREVVMDPMLRKYSVIVMDEAHERSVNTDVLLGVLKNVVRQRADFKLIVTSATMDISKFSRFFDNAPYFEIPGKTFPVDVRYEPQPVEDYVREAVLRICEIHCQLEEKGDILVFLTGKDDITGTIEMVKEELNRIADGFADTLLLLPCYSELPGEEQRKVMEPAPEGKRKCVVSTNVAETSLTIDGIRYVIDPGLMKTNVFRPNIGMNTLQLYPVCQAQANQRKGRAGRTQAGVCHRLFMEAQFVDDMLMVAVPEIQRSSIDMVVLLLKHIGVEDLLQFDFIDPPPEVNIRNSLFHLWMLGALSDTGSSTEESRLLLEFPTEPAMAKLLVESARMGCSEEALSVVAMMNVDSKAVFVVPQGRENEASMAHEKFYHPESDHLTLYNVLQQFVVNGRSASWAQDHFINVQAVNRAHGIRTQLAERLTRAAKLPLASCGYDLDRIRECLARSYFSQAAQRKKWTEYTTLLSGVTCHVHPSSALHLAAQMPDYAIYNEFLLTTKEYMSCVTAVRGEWLAAASRGIITVKGDDAAVHQRIVSDAIQVAKKEEEKKKAIVPLIRRQTGATMAQMQREGQAQLAKRKKVNL